MPELRTADGRYLFAEQGDGNAVFYDTSTTPWTVLADRWSYEAGQRPSPAAPPQPTPQPPSPGQTPGGGGALIQVTDASDGELVKRMYAYWANTWVTPEGTTAWVFVGHVDGRPRFFEVALSTGEVTRHGPLLSRTGTSEGWYWTPEGQISFLDGPRLCRVNPRLPSDSWADTVLDISETHPGCDLWQAHSSEDDTTHCATVRRIVPDGKYPHIGTVVSKDGRQIFYEAQGTLDESALAGNEWVVIKEVPQGNPPDANDNRVIHLVSGESRILRDADGALGHSDCGPDFMVGESNLPGPGACRLYDLRQPLIVSRSRALFTTDNLGYLAYRAWRLLHSDPTHLRLIDLRTGAATPLLAHGVPAGAGYDDRVKANLSPCGRVACYMAHGTVYLLRLES